MLFGWATKRSPELLFGRSNTVIPQTKMSTTLIQKRLKHTTRRACCGCTRRWPWLVGGGCVLLMPPHPVVFLQTFIALRDLCNRWEGVARAAVDFSALYEVFRSVWLAILSLTRSWPISCTQRSNWASFSPRISSNG
jgi:hypothetical protein